MGYPIKIDGVPAMIESAEIVNYISRSALLRLWRVNPFTVERLGNVNTDSPTPTIFAAHSAPSEILRDGDTIDFRDAETVYLLAESQHAEVSAPDAMYGYHPDSRYQNLWAYKVLTVSRAGLVQWIGGPESDKQFWTGFVKGAAVWAAVVYVAVALPGIVGGMSATGVPIAATVPGEWAVATAGMGEGIGTFSAIGTAAVETSTVGSVWQTVTGAGTSIVSGAQTLAGAATATRLAIDTVQRAATPPVQHAPQSAPQDNTMIYAAGIAAIFLMGI